MRFKYFKVSLVAFSLFISCWFNVASAGLINTTTDSFIDETAQLEWMDFGINNGYSFNGVLEQLDVGGVYEGWSLASSDQVSELWINAFSSLNSSYYREYTPFIDSGQVGAKNDFYGSSLDSVFSLMGYNALTDYGTYSYGLFYSDGGSLEAFGIEDRVNIGAIDSAYAGPCSNYGENYIGLEQSTMLVRAVDVPEPSSLVLFVFGLMGLALRRFKNEA